MRTEFVGFINTFVLLTTIFRSDDQSRQTETCRTIVRFSLELGIGD